MESLDYISKNDYLKRYFEDIPREELRKHCRLVIYKPQNIIVKKGEHINFIGIIISGRALLVNEFANGNAYILKELKLLSIIKTNRFISSSLLSFNINLGLLFAACDGAIFQSISSL